MFTVLWLIAFAAAYGLFLQYLMHMFQLNGYKNDEHINWIKKNLRQQWLLGFGLVLGILRIIFPALILDIVIYLTLMLDILVYRAMRRLNTKKKLVYTARVKRMIVTILIITVSAVILVAIFGLIVATEEAALTFWKLAPLNVAVYAYFLAFGNLTNFVATPFLTLTAYVFPLILNVTLPSLTFFPSLVTVALSFTLDPI